MSILRDLQQTVTNGVEDAAKLTQLVVEDASDKIKGKIRKEAIQEKVEDLKEGYQHMKESIKNELE